MPNVTLTVTALPPQPKTSITAPCISPPSAPIALSCTWCAVLTLPTNLDC